MFNNCMLDSVDSDNTLDDIPCRVAHSESQQFLPVDTIFSLAKKILFLPYMPEFTEPLIGHGKIKIAPCIKSCAQDDLVITRK